MKLRYLLLFLLLTGWTCLLSAQSPEKPQLGLALSGLAKACECAEPEVADAARALSAEGREIRTPLDWEAALLEVRVGDTLAVGLGEVGERRVALVAAELPSLTAERVNALREFELVTLTPAIRAERGLSNEQGALIVGVSQAVRRQLGLREGDLIVGINRYAVDSAEEAAAYLRELQDLPGRVVVRLLVERSGRESYVSFRL